VDDLRFWAKFSLFSKGLISRRQRSPRAINPTSPEQNGARNFTPRSWPAIPFRSAAALPAILGLLIVASVALAVPSSVPDDSVQTNGRVSAILTVGNMIYIAGDFTSVDGEPRNRFAAIDATSGALTNWSPSANRRVQALALSPDGTRIYAGGNFSSINGISRSRLVALDPVTGAVDTTWNPTTDGTGTVYAISVVGNRVYLGGSFTSVNGQSRSRLAMVDSATGALDSRWVPRASDRVRAVVPSQDGTRIYVGGSFGSISGLSRPRLGAVDPLTGSVQSWRPSQTPNGLVYNLVEFNGRVYTAEDGTGGAVAAYTTTTGSRTWRHLGDGDVQAVAMLGDRLYVGGHFGQLGRQSRRHFAALVPATGAFTDWAPKGSGGAGVWSLVGDPSRARLYAGGDFTSISGQAQQGFAQFSE
jgi:hypothetical protein